MSAGPCCAWGALAPCLAAHQNQCTSRSAGAPAPLLTDVSLSLPPNKLGLVFGRSGAGKTTLLQLVAGLSQPTAGSISFSGPQAGANGAGAAAVAGGLPSEARMVQVRRVTCSWGGRAMRQHVGGCKRIASPLERRAAHQAALVPPCLPPLPTLAARLRLRTLQAGLVFQFPERHFIGRTLSQELTVGWPLAPEQILERQARRQGDTTFCTLLGAAVPLLLVTGNPFLALVWPARAGERLTPVACPQPGRAARHVPTGPAPKRYAPHPVQALAVRTQQVLAAVGLEALPLDVPLAHLSDGYKRCACLGAYCRARWGGWQSQEVPQEPHVAEARPPAFPCDMFDHFASTTCPPARRVALAVQLVRRPRLLMLDEPLAGACGGVCWSGGGVRWLAASSHHGPPPCLRQAVAELTVAPLWPTPRRAGLAHPPRADWPA